MDLVLTKWIALKGTSVLASCRAEELSSRFPSVMIRDAAGFTCYLSTEREYQISGGYGAAAIYPLGKGGVLGGLWNMLEQINAGMEIGRTNDGNDRIIYNQGKKRYLDRPQKEELEKVFD